VNLDRLKLKATAGLALAVAGALGAIGLGLLLYAVLKIWLVPPVAAGISFLIFASVAYVASRMIAGGADQGHAASHQKQSGAVSPPQGLPERAMELARRRPIVALVGGGLIAALALRNPVLIATVVGAILNRGHHRR